MRLALGLVTGFFLGLGLTALAVTAGPGETCVDVPTFGVQICGTTTTTTTSTTTTSTTTLVEIPAKQSVTIRDRRPGPGADTEGYLTMLRSGSPSGVLLWDAPYAWPPNYTDTNGNTHNSSGLPYVDGYGWIEGDRIGYCGKYGFLVDPDGEIIGRFAALSANYTGASEAVGFVNDRFMPEGEYFANGTPNDGRFRDRQAYSGAWCRGFSDTVYQPSDADERPLPVFWHNGVVVENRDYAPTAAGPGVTFELIEEIDTPFTETDPFGQTLEINSRVTVLGLLDGEPAIVFYYDGIGDGSVTEERLTTFP